MAIAQKEFDIMVQEMIGGDTPQYDMLIEIAEQVLRPHIKRWMFKLPALKQYGTDDDIMNDVHVLLITRTISSFLLKNGANEPVNNDPDGFCAWIYTVARNHVWSLFRDKINPDQKHLAPILLEELGVDIFEEMAEIERGRSDLNDSFSKVMGMNTAIYKKLTWAAQFVIIASTNRAKHHTSDLIDKRFSEVSLFAMYKMIKMAARRNVHWMELSPELDEMVLFELNKTDDDGNLYGDELYKNFYMAKGGKASISDWINRINTILRREADK